MTNTVYCKTEGVRRDSVVLYLSVHTYRVKLFSITLKHYVMLYFDGFIILIYYFCYPFVMDEWATHISSMRGYLRQNILRNLARAKHNDLTVMK
jgi:hypothetical protein